MVFELITLSIETSRQYEAINITDRIRDSLTKTGIVDGFASIFCPHTTAGIVINEPESGLLRDIEKLYSEIIPKGDYHHDRIDNNARSHLSSCLVSASVVLPVSQTKLALGTWQGVIFCEFDGPRKRKLELRVLGSE